jgi:oxygen-independent coproporphyrinogen-3 oxidase
MTPCAPSRRLHSQLPIFLLEMPETSVVYSPGHVAAVPTASVSLLEKAFASLLPDAPDWLARLVHGFVDCGQRAAHAWHELRYGEFRPACLTVYLSNACNLGCSYCFATENDGSRKRPAAVAGALPLIETRPLPLIDEQKLLLAARLVAQSCRSQGKPFQLVVHGGGEPTLHWGLLERIVQRTRQIAAAHEVQWTSYIASHGVLERQKVQYLAENFDRIGISCDGPPDIHDAQRPKLTAESTFENVAETIRILREGGANLTLRATITKQSLQRQAEIVSFFVTAFGALSIRFEPMYHGHKVAAALLSPTDAETFAQHFLAAQRVADVLGAELKLSGVRLDEIHGPYCNVLRDVVQITPDNSASACFLVTDARERGAAEMIIGAVNPSTGDFELDFERIRRMRRNATEIPVRCEECVNIYHCARDCPDVCPVSEQAAPATENPGFRCLVQKELGYRWIVDAALHNRPPSVGTPTEEMLVQSQQIGRALCYLPADVDAEAIVRQWRDALSFAPFGDRAMPTAPWSQSGFEDVGDQAWERLSQRLECASPQAPMSCYVHIPYCDRKCGFCDCYKFYLPSEDAQKRLNYVNALIREIQGWSRFAALTRRPLTTAHFGGGTPSYLPPNLFERFLDVFRATFRHTAQTEWALETTTSQLDDEYVANLQRWGFSRLHVGIQSLNDDTRKLIGRRESAAVALGKLRRLLEKGLVVTIDLIYGLPGQLPADFIHDLETLIDLGVDGCSLYHLNVSPRNQAFYNQTSSQSGSAFEHYLYFQLGEAVLTARGYKKTHFAHFSRERDKNLYYTHAVRGEDLLALGTLADGSFGSYCYRHAPISDYVSAADGQLAPLEGGLEDRESPRLRAIMSSLLAGSVEPDNFAKVGAHLLRDQWIQSGMLTYDAGRQADVLTANGSWFLSRLLCQLRELR